MSKKLFIKSLFLTIIIDVIVKPLGVLVEIFTQEKIGHSEWGTYAALLSFGTVFIFINELGFTPLLTKIIANKKEKLETTSNEMLSLRIITALFFPVFLVSIGYCIGYREHELFLLTLISGIHVFAQFVYFFRAGLQGKQAFKKDAILQLVEKSAFVIFISIFLFLDTITIEFFIFIRISTLLIFCILLIHTCRSLGLFKTFSFSFKNIQSIWKMGLPFIFITALTSINEKIDQVMLERIYSSYETGLYNAAYRILDAALMFLWIILPMFFSKFADVDTPKQDKEILLKRGILIFALPLLLISFGSLHFGHFLFSTFEIENGRVYITTIFQILCLSLSIHGLFAILGVYLLSNGHATTVNYSILLSIVINVILNAIFIPTYGAIAAAWATAASTLVFNFAYLIIIKLKADIKIPWGLISFLFCIICVYAYLVMGIEGLKTSH